MTREQAINRWTDIAETVFWAEDRISKDWNEKLKATAGKSKEERAVVARDYWPYPSYTDILFYR
jgi:hypothetical protein